MYKERVIFFVRHLRAHDDKIPRWFQCKWQTGVQENLGASGI
jgi:hypothetical protein